MKTTIKAFLLLLICVCFSASAVFAEDEDWKHVKEITAKDAVFNYYYDSKNVKEIPGPVLQVPTKLTDVRTIEDAEVRYERKDIVELDCAERRGRVHKYGKYRHIKTADEKQKNDILFFKNYEWHQIKPESVYEHLHKLVCK